MSVPVQPCQTFLKQHMGVLLAFLVNLHNKIILPIDLVLFNSSSKMVFPLFVVELALAPVISSVIATC